MNNQVDQLEFAYRCREPDWIGGIGDDVARTDLLGGRAQRGFASCREHDVVAQLGQLAATSFSDPAAAAGDQCGSQQHL